MCRSKVCDFTVHDLEDSLVCVSWCISVCLSPDDAYRVRLLMHPGVSGSDYINAAYIDVSLPNQRLQFLCGYTPALSSPCRDTSVAINTL